MARIEDLPRELVELVGVCEVGGGLIKGPAGGEKVAGELVVRYAVALERSGDSSEVALQWTTVVEG